ncbi:MAG: SOS response-associated peptidase, partial [Pelagibacteraceae bacterium]
MCGRYVITKPVSKTLDLVKTNIKVEDTDNFNAHPSQKLPVIKSYTNGKALENLEWGLTPSWAKDKKDFKPLINARVETLVEKISFKKLIQTSRCLVVADGYYEWK